jgi:two-component system cell cycle response regulator CpdR
MGRRVLVVDDDALVLEVTASMLQELGCDVLQAHSGNDALEKIVDDPSIEILITDINMPGLSGTELAQRVRSFRDQLHVILLSGRESDSHGYPLIRKPVLRSDLQRVVAETSGPG